jgi:hypothetical protein
MSNKPHMIADSVMFYHHLTRSIPVAQGILLDGRQGKEIGLSACSVTT